MLGEREACLRPPDECMADGRFKAGTSCLTAPFPTRYYTCPLTELSGDSDLYPRSLN